MINSTTSIPVAIVGGGPIGLTLALFLDFHGIQSVVFNSEQVPRWHPKGSTEGATTMEHFRRLGIAHQIRKLGLPPDHPTDVAYFTRFGGIELTRIRMPSTNEILQGIAESPKTDQVPEPIHRGNQMYVERFLFDHASTRENINMRFGWHVTGFEQHADGVQLAAEHKDNGVTEISKAQYLVGADGGRSLIRRALGIVFRGEAGLEQRYFGERMFSTYLPCQHFTEISLVIVEPGNIGPLTAKSNRAWLPSMAKTSSCFAFAPMICTRRRRMRRSLRRCGDAWAPIFRFRS